LYQWKPLTNITYIDSSTITATVPEGYKPGVYNLHLTNSDGEHIVLHNAFQVCQTYYKDFDQDSYGIDDDYICSHDPEGEYTAIQAGDCNDDDAAIHPGATEVCDGIDNDCDGNIDEGFDRDADGYTTCAGDCDDNDNTIYPGAPGTYKGKDTNCNGITDTDEKRRSIYPVYTPILSSGPQYQQLWALSFLPLYLDQQRQSWYEYQYTFYQQQLIKTIPIRNQFLGFINQPYWHYPYLPRYFVGNENLLIPPFHRPGRLRSSLAAKRPKALSAPALR